MKKVAVVMGSASDLPLAKDALRVLASFGVPYTARVLSAHRTPEEAAALPPGWRLAGVHELHVPGLEATRQLAVVERDG